ncbi:nucleotide reductase subunit C [Escherichia phage T4]|nr:nucleotide reductase subunit C [Escherichia phage T4]
MNIENKLDVDAVLSEIIEDHDAFSENYDFDFSDYLKPIEIEDWVQDGKCQYRLNWLSFENV